MRIRGRDRHAAQAAHGVPVRRPARPPRRDGWPANGHRSSRVGLLRRGIRRRPPGSGRLEPHQPPYAGRRSASMGGGRIRHLVRSGRLPSARSPEPRFGSVAAGSSVRVRSRSTHELDASSIAPAPEGDRRDRRPGHPKHELRSQRPCLERTAAGRRRHAPSSRRATPRVRPGGSGLDLCRRPSRAGGRRRALGIWSHNPDDQRLDFRPFDR